MTSAKLDCTNNIAASGVNTARKCETCPKPVSAPDLLPDVFLPFELTFSATTSNEFFVLFQIVL
ncbi:hypothetical protein QSG83_05640 [Acinetobacter towneri]|nr:hypothetical protein [Acinetobacter towneri]WOE30328.1 hypothetical protein QSG83_05640 [Acinetobacter towneri]